jgi:hypothetical protein
MAGIGRKEGGATPERERDRPCSPSKTGSCAMGSTAGFKFDRLTAKPAWFGPIIINPMKQGHGYLFNNGIGRRV